MRKLALAAAAAAVVGLFAGSAMAADPNFPSAKHAVMVGNIHVVRELGPIGPDDDDRLSTVGTIMSTKIKTGNQKHLMAIVSLECGNLTETHVKSKGGKSDTSTAVASVRVAVDVDAGTANAQRMLPTGDNSRTFTQIGGVDVGGDDGVVFCRRTQELEAKFQGIINIPTGGDLAGCLEDVINSLNKAEWVAEDPLGLGLTTAELEAVFDAIIAGDDLATINGIIEGFGGTAITQGELDSQLTSQQIEDECLLPEEVRLLLDSMTATTFVFVAPVTSGTHHIDVKAWVDLGAEAQEGSARAAATIGLGTVVVEEIRLVGGSGADISCDNTVQGSANWCTQEDADSDGIHDNVDLCPAEDGVYLGGTTFDFLDNDNDGILDRLEANKPAICTP
jgi:hypothetical protein